MNRSKSSKTRPPEKINGIVRILCGILGLAALYLSIHFFIYPPQRIHLDKDLNGTVVKQTEFPADPTSVSLGFLIGAGLAIFLAANGYRLAKFSMGGIIGEASTQTAGDQAENFFKNTSSESTVDSENIKGKGESPNPTESPSKILDDSLAVYELIDVPTTVILDLLKSWPNSSLPQNLAEFEFATRKRGKGNHPWMIKFNGHPLITVSYGGQAKETSTVISESPQ